MPALNGARNDTSPANQATARKVVRAARRATLATICAALLERLVDAEIRDLQPERVHPHKLVGNPVAHREVDLRDEGLAPAFLARPWRVQEPLEADRGPERRPRQLAQ